MVVPGMYLMNVSLCLGVLYLLYIALFRFTTFFMVNRYYLLGSLLFSFLAPALELPIANTGYDVLSAHPVATAFRPQIYDDIPGDPAATSTGAIKYFSILSALYYAGAVAGLARIVHSIFGIVRIRRKAERIRDGYFEILKADVSQPFSVFNFIFLPKGETDPMIIAHEKIHIRQFHMIDLILAEVAGVVLWFNPLMIYFRRSLKAQHEYLADAYTIRNCAPIERYLELLWLQVRIGFSRGPVSHFYSKSIKNRIIMMTRNRTSIRYYGLYLLLIPVSCLLLFAFSIKPAGGSFVDRRGIVTNNDVVIIVDPGHGGSDPGAESPSGLVEKELTLSIAKKVQQIANKKGVKVMLTRASDENVTLNERMLISKKASAKMFVSIHINTHSDVSRSGIECVISKGNIGFDQSRKFGDQLLNELRGIKGIGVNGILQSDFHILKNNTIPAIALELGYLSNEADQAFIASDENRNIMAESIVSAAIKNLK